MQLGCFGHGKKTQCGDAYTKTPEKLKHFYNHVTSVDSAQERVALTCCRYMNVKAQDSCGHASTFGSATHVPPARGCCMVLPCSLRSAREGACMRGRWSRLTAETHGLLKLFSRSYNVSDFYFRSTRRKKSYLAWPSIAYACVCACLNFDDSTRYPCLFESDYVCARVVCKCVLVLMQVCVCKS